MVFSSLHFLLIFLPLFLIGYHLIVDKFKNNYTLLASLFFYFWGATNFIIIVILSIVVDFFIVRIMELRQGVARKSLMWASILFNLSFLLYYKYFNFFLDNYYSIFGVENQTFTEIILPIGISFFTFQKISYTLDVYFRKNKPLKKITDYSLYILLFPQLIAGPIVRFNEIAAQISNRDSYNYLDKVNGIYRFSIGLAKKVIIANTLGAKADLIFNLETVDLNTSVAWFGILCYTFQIYFDFSGYSDMAIGLGRLMGFKFPENFNSPYVSQSITEFWKRWHITLGSWMRDYLYIPLGGNRVKTKSRLYFNLWLVFLISGFWHGASWNFVLWGAYHGVFLIFDRLFLNDLTSKLGKVFRIVLTFFLVMMGWVLFRAENLHSAIEYYKVLFSFDFGFLHLFTSVKVNRTLFIAIFLSFALGIPWLNIKYDRFTNSVATSSISTKFILSFFFVLISVASLTSSGFNPFIYFRF